MFIGISKIYNSSMHEEMEKPFKSKVTHLYCVIEKERNIQRNSKIKEKRKIYGRLSRNNTARGSCTSFVTVGPTEV